MWVTAEVNQAKAALPFSTLNLLCLALPEILAYLHTSKDCTLLLYMEYNAPTHPHSKNAYYRYMGNACYVYVCYTLL